MNIANINVGGDIIPIHVPKIYTFSKDRLIISPFIWELVHSYFVEDANGARINQSPASFFVGIEDRYDPEEKEVITSIIPSRFSRQHLTKDDRDKLLSTAHQHGLVSILTQTINNGFIWRKTGENWKFWNDLISIIWTLRNGCKDFWEPKYSTYEPRTAEAYLTLIASFGVADMMHLSFNDFDLHRYAWELLLKQDNT